MEAARILVGALVWTVAASNGKIPDVHVTCLFSEDCLLPCAFKPAAEEAIDWSRQDVPVHNFTSGGDQLDQQHERYRGRTAMFPEQVARGNASLLLRTCNTQDRGRYRCHVTTDLGEQESFVIAKVEAPVQSLTLEMTQLSGYQELKCSTHGVYPAPHVTWSTVPTEPLDVLKPVTRKAADNNGLYSVESKMRKLSGKGSRVYTYFCTVDSSYDTQTWTASLQERELSGKEGAELTIPCLSPTALQNFTLTWTFTRADTPEDLLTFDSQSGWRSSDRWAGLADVARDGVLSGDGSLRLRGLRPEKHAGTYTCTFSAAQTRHTVHASVNVTTAAAEKLEGAGTSRLWVIAVVLAAVILLVTLLLLCCRSKAGQSRTSKGPDVATEMQAVPTDEKENGIPSENSNLRKDQTEERT